MLIGCLDSCANFGEDNFDALSSAATKWSIKLLKKSDQCISVFSCAHLFLSAGGESSEKVLVCLKRALTAAKQAQGMAKSSRGDVGPTELFVAILNKYLYFFDKQVRWDQMHKDSDTHTHTLACMHQHTHACTLFKMN